MAKKSTSVSVDDEALAIVQQFADIEDRSVSYMLEKFIKQLGEQLQQKIVPLENRNDNQPKRKRAR